MFYLSHGRLSLFCLVWKQVQHRMTFRTWFLFILKRDNNINSIEKCMRNGVEKARGVVSKQVTCFKSGMAKRTIKQRNKFFFRSRAFSCTEIRSPFPLLNGYSTPYSMMAVRKTLDSCRQFLR